MMHIFVPVLFVAIYIVGMSASKTFFRLPPRAPRRRTGS